MEDNKVINGVDEAGKVVEVEEVKYEDGPLEEDAPVLEEVEDLVEVTGIYVHEFSQPKKYNGKEIESITFDYNSLTGKSFIQIEKEMTDKGEVALDPMLSRTFQAKLAAKAGKVGVDFIEGLSLGDFYRITSSARNFLVQQA